MKRKLLYLLAALFAGAFLWSCDPVDTGEDFDESLLYGYWRSADEYRYYAPDGTGYFWDPAEDVDEDYAKEYLRFTWELDNSDFPHIYIRATGANVPAAYEMVTLTAQRLVYRDDFETYSYNKTTQP